MKFKWQEVVLAVLFGFILPMTLASLTKGKDITEQALPPETIKIQIEKPKETIRILKNDGTVETVNLETYLTSVILREMPARFDEEALKAQAVVARTYALKRKKGTKHTGADVCTQSSCCQGYYDLEDYLADGGKKDNIENAKNAVKATEGEVLKYQNNLIDATYFACSGGRTESAVAVWGTDIPYLQSTESPGEESAKHYTDTVTLTKKEFIEALQLPAGKEVTIDYIQYTEGGGIDVISLSNNAIQGTTFRKKLGLKSTAVILSVVGDTVTITTKGNGHRVGMSQYGANAMAENGANYREILLHYYNNVELVNTLTFTEN